MVKVVHGKNSISWANSVLPVFMRGSAGGCPGIFSDLHFDVQIDTELFALNRLSFKRSVIRTLV
jgi:hypothetical protein